LKIIQSFWQRALQYKPDKTDIDIILKGVGIVILFGYFFYDSITACFILSPILILYYVTEKNKKNKKRIMTIGLQFKDLLMSVITAQRAGYSVENAFIDSKKEMELMHGKNSIICAELDIIIKGLANNLTLEELLFDFGVRSKNDDIIEFAEIFAIAKRSGGNMTEIMNRSASIIGKRLETQGEIEILISAKKGEAKIMEAIPFFIIAYIGFTSEGYFDSMYHNAAGIAIMSVCLVIYIVAHLMFEKITAIEI